MDVGGESPAPPGGVPLPGMAASTPAVRPPSLAQYGTGGSSAFGSQMSYGSAYSNDDASYGATAPGVLGMGQAAPGAYVSPRASFEDVPFSSPPGVSDMRAYDAYEQPPPAAPRRSRLATFSAWLLRLAILVHGLAALAHYALHGAEIKVVTSPPRLLNGVVPDELSLVDFHTGPGVRFTDARTADAAAGPQVPGPFGDAS